MTGGKKKLFIAGLSVLAATGLMVTSACESLEGFQESCGSSKEDTNHVWVVDTDEKFADERATCTKDGTLHYYCSNSGCDAEMTIEEKALGHNWVIDISVPDDLSICVSPGTITATCTRCDYTETMVFLEPLGHDYTSVIYKTDEDGEGAWYKCCSRCEAIDEETGKLNESFVLSSYTIHVGSEEGLQDVILRADGDIFPFEYNIKLCDDFLVTSPVVFENINVSLDLAGHEIKGESSAGDALLTVGEGATLAIEDSSSSGIITYATDKGANQKAVEVIKGGKIELISGTIEGYPALALDGGAKAVIKGGIVCTGEGTAYPALQIKGEAEICGGEIYSDGTAVSVDAPEDSSSEVALNINGGTISGEVYGLTVSDKIDTSYSVLVNITDGKITGGHTAAFFAGYGTYSICGGTITSAKTTGDTGVGIEIRAGKLEISGSAEIIGTTTSGGNSYLYNRDNVYGNAEGPAVDGGVALAIVQHVTKLETKVKIEGGTFKANFAVYEIDAEKNKDGGLYDVSLSISDGLFDGKIYSENLEGFISGCTFADVSVLDNMLDKNGEYISEDVAVKLENGIYSSLEKVLTDAPDGSEITLLNDFSVRVTEDGEAEGNEIWESAVEIKTNLTLVLNGHSITISSNSDSEAAIVVSGSLTINPGEGTNTLSEGDEHASGAIIISTFSVAGIEVAQGGTLTISEGATIATNDITSLILAGGTLNVYGSVINSNADTNSRAICIQGGGEVNIYDGAYVSGTNGIFLKQDTAEDSIKTLSVYGGEVTGTGTAITGNGKDEGISIINIFGGEISNESDTAIYLPAAGTRAVISGGKITSGTTGIVLRGGLLTIEGGEIISSYSGDFSATPDDNGSNIQGAAVAIDQYSFSTADDMITLVMSGGALKGKYSIYENKLAAVEGTYSATVSITLTGGTREGVLYSANSDITISGNATFTPSTTDADSTTDAESKTGTFIDSGDAYVSFSTSGSNFSFLSHEKSTEDGSVTYTDYTEIKDYSSKGISITIGSSAEGTSISSKITVYASHTTTNTGTEEDHKNPVRTIYISSDTSSTDDNVLAKKTIDGTAGDCTYLHAVVASDVKSGTYYIYLSGSTDAVHVYAVVVSYTITISAGTSYTEPAQEEE